MREDEIRDRAPTIPRAEVCAKSEPAEYRNREHPNPDTLCVSAEEDERRRVWRPRERITDILPEPVPAPCGEGLQEG